MEIQTWKFVKSVDRGNSEIIDVGHPPKIKFTKLVESVTLAEETFAIPF